jgi:ribose/xylose/arabinose/galactoside ABC-type transport system permease subunit
MKTQSSGEEAGRKKTRRNFHEIIKIKELGIFLCLCCLVLFFSITSKVFFSANNLLNIVRQVSLLGIQALGMTFVIAVGGIDISVGAIYALSATSAAVLMTQLNIPIFVSFALGIGVGILFGVINGFIIGYLMIPTFLATMGTMNMARGLALLMSKGMIISLDRDPVVDKENLPLFFNIGGGIIHNIPSLAIIFAALSIVAYIFFHKSIYGFHMRAIGGSQDAARASGINVKKINLLTYVVLGFLCALTGILNFSFMHTVQGTMGTGMELEVIAAVIIGGANPTGGTGTIVGTIIGVLIMGVLKNGLILLGVNPHAQTVIIGMLIVIVVAFDVNSQRNRRKE